MNSITALYTVFFSPQSTGWLFCYFLVHAGSFRVSVVHRTLAWTTGSLPCVAYVIILMRAYCLYTRGVGHTDSESAQQKQFGTRKNSHKLFLCFLMRFLINFIPKSTECYRDVNLILCTFAGFSGHGLISNPTFYQLCHPAIPHKQSAVV